MLGLCCYCFTALIWYFCYNPLNFKILKPKYSTSNLDKYTKISQHHTSDLETHVDISYTYEHCSNQRQMYKHSKGYSVKQMFVGSEQPHLSSACLFAIEDFCVFTLFPYELSSEHWFFNTFMVGTRKSEIPRIQEYPKSFSMMLKGVI